MSTCFLALTKPQLKKSVIRKLRNFLAAVATSPSVPGLIGTMTDAVRCLTWESLFPLIEDLFQDANYAILIRSTATFNLCHIELEKLLDAYNAPEWQTVL
jgi:hypothetical protein